MKCNTICMANLVTCSWGICSLPVILASSSIHISNRIDSCLGKIPKGGTDF